METKNQLQNVSNGIILVGGGLLVLLAKGIFLNPVSRFILAGVAGVWGLFQLIANPKNKTAGLTALAAGGVLAIFGGVLSALSTIGGIGLIVAGGVSLIARFFSRK